MKIDIILPSPGESINQVQISQWHKKSGDFIEQNEVILEIESEKATLEIQAEKSGRLKILLEEGVDASPGDIAGSIDTSIVQEKTFAINNSLNREKQSEIAQTIQLLNKETTINKNTASASVTAKKMMRESQIHQNQVIGTGKRGFIKNTDVINEINQNKFIGIGKRGFIKNTDVINEINQNKFASVNAPETIKSQRIVPQNRNNRSFETKKITKLRQKLSERLVKVKNDLAMLTTFNEINMQAVIDTRKKYKEIFKETHDVNLGFMSFFTKACAVALQEFNQVASQIVEDEIITPHFVDIGIAVSAPQGLMVPVLRNVQTMSLSDIETSILHYAGKAREKKLSIDDMSGGCFTITNGGVFGSMLSTPIINPPQSAILGMHNIVKRPIAINDEVKIRPIMYVALSYDHRIIDGKDSVGFLYRIKELIEDPIRLLLQV